MKFLRRLWWRIRRWLTGQPVPYRTIHVPELPDSLRKNCAYLVGENEFVWFVAMICPCGCGEVLYMNLLEARRPSWKVIEHTDGTVSLMPSVWRMKGCSSHFYFRRGTVEWCDATRSESVSRA